MKSLIIAGVLVVSGFGAVGPAWAQTSYVSDQLVITFRTGPGTQFGITRNLSSGDRVEVIEVLEEGGYSRVRLADGTEGWVLTQYLQTEPTASRRLAAATSELEAERQRAAELAQRLDELETSFRETSAALDATRSNADQLTAELTDVRSASASALQTRQQNEEYRRQIDEMTAKAQVAAMEIDELRRRERQNWFVIGAAVLLGGIIIGLVAPSLRPKRKSSW